MSYVQANSTYIIAILFLKDIAFIGMDRFLSGITHNH
jgi:hypothetical protein